MSAKENLNILLVDDEPDVLDTLGELLPMHNVLRAGTFEEAKEILESKPLDMAVLDIMGVRGYDLLDIAVAKNVTAVMFTAHAVSPEDSIKSFRNGAAYYVPKDKMSEMPQILTSIYERRQAGQNTWVSFFDWADKYFSVKFGPRWEQARRELQDKLG